MRPLTQQRIRDIRRVNYHTLDRAMALEDHSDLQGITGIAVSRNTGSDGSVKKAEAAPACSETVLRYYLHRHLLFRCLCNVSVTASELICSRPLENFPFVRSQSVQRLYNMRSAKEMFLRDQQRLRFNTFGSFES